MWRLAPSSDWRRLVRGLVPEWLYRGLSQAVNGPPPWEPGVALPPPPTPAGMVTGPPDFVGVGAQKAGTSWWHTLIHTHPDTWHAERIYKERHFFARFSHRPFEPHHVAEYHRWFPRPEGKRTGEWTPNYMLHFWTPPLLAQAAPKAKILVLLRDPVERYRSGLQHHLDRNLPPDARLAAESFHRGLYRDQLRWLAQHVDRERILVLQYEQCVAEPQQQLARTYRFLGLDDGWVPEALRDTVNARRSERPPMDPVTRDQLIALYRDQVEGVVADGWPIDPGRWRNFG